MVEEIRTNNWTNTGSHQFKSKERNAGYTALLQDYYEGIITVSIATNSSIKLNSVTLHFVLFKSKQTQAERGTEKAYLIPGKYRFYHKRKTKNLVVFTL